MLLQQFHTSRVFDQISLLLLYVLGASLTVSRLKRAFHCASRAGVWRAADVTVMCVAVTMGVSIWPVATVIQTAMTWRTGAIPGWSSP